MRFVKEVPEDACKGGYYFVVDTQSPANNIKKDETPDAFNCMCDIAWIDTNAAWLISDDYPEDKLLIECNMEVREPKDFWFGDRIELPHVNPE